ncbi:MAG: GumC family protein [Minwuia sp.]|uniref:GumC family protein n=1 Tax=Minwuia sp. TaxID=2493630 RepID=UPI003A8A835C
MTDTPRPEASTREVTLVDFIHYIKRNYLSIAVAIVLSFSVVYFIMSFRIPIYAAQTSLLYRPNQTDFANVNLLASGVDVSQATINNEIEIIRSTALLSRVVERAGLDQDPEFITPAKSFDFNLLSTVVDSQFRTGVLGWVAAALGWNVAQDTDESSQHRLPRVDRSDVAATLRGRIEAESERFSYAFTLQAKSNVPEKAALLANTVADAYIDDQLEAKFSETRRATKWLSDRIAELEGRVRESETAAAQKRAEFAEVTGRDASTISQQIAQVSAQLVTAQSNLTAARSRYEIANSRRNQGEAINSAGIQNSDATDRLLQLRTELRRREAELSARYLEKHPKLIAVREDLRETERRLGQAVDSAVGDARAELRAAEITVQNLSNELRRLERQFQAYRQADVEIRQLDREAEADRNLYETYLARLRESTAKEDVQTADVRILRRATVSTNPVGIPALYIAVAGGLGGGALWLCLGFAVGLLRQGFNHRDEIEDTLGETVLAVVPEVKSRKLERGVVEYLQNEPETGFAESFRAAKSVLALRSVASRNSVVCITSSIPGEGKTTFASGLAHEISKTSRCLLIEGDLRRPSFSNQVVIGNGSVGVIDVLAGKVSLSDAVVNVPGAELSILYASTTTGDSLKLLEF